jgi:hypothetical protein
MLDGDPDEQLRLWYERKLGLPFPKNWWAAEWQMKPISEWPGYEKAIRKCRAKMKSADLPKRLSAA